MQEVGIKFNESLDMMITLMMYQKQSFAHYILLYVFFYRLLLTAAIQYCIAHAQLYIIILI